MYFEQAAKEVAAGEIQAGLHAMALSKCEGDEVKAAAMYLQLRVDMLKQGAAVGEKIMEAAERDEQERAKREAREKEIRIADKRVSMFEAEPQPGDLASIILVVFSLTVVATVLFWLTEVS